MAATPKDSFIQSGKTGKKLENMKKGNCLASKKYDLRLQYFSNYVCTRQGQKMKLKDCKHLVSASNNT